MKRRISRINIAILIGVVISILIPVMLFSMSYADVRAQLIKSSPAQNLRLKLKGVRPSRTHIIWIEYQVLGDDGYSWAAWRLWPFRQVDFSM